MAATAFDSPAPVAEKPAMEKPGVGKPVAEKHFSIATLGCKVNVFESELIAQKLTAQNYRRVAQNDPADLCLINTCTVTAEADRQARQLVRRAIRNNPDARIVVTGCYAQIDPDACSAIPGVDLVVGNGGKLDIPELLEKLDDGQTSPTPIVQVGDLDKEISLPQQLISGFEGRARAFVQIQQGCDQGCTFCIIHKARGPNRSFPAAMIRRQAERLVMNGYRELVICGVDIGSYGSDFPQSGDSPGDGLNELLGELATIEGDFRLRLSSIDPAHITDSLIERMATEPVLCPQLHLSLQSANTLILKRMKRRATREVVYERIAKLRRAIPHLVLSADIMVGFPTESAAHFGQTLDAVEDLEIAYPHVFAYSPRPGTPAARIPNQVPVDERKRRAALVRERGRSVWRRVAAGQVGAQTRVLIEGSGNRPDGLDAPGGLVRARAANYFPVIFTPQREQPGDWAEVEINSVEGDALIAHRIDTGVQSPPLNPPRQAHQKHFAVSLTT